MLSTRLALALESGTVRFPDEGRIAVIGPAADSDLSMLPKDRVDIIERHKPRHDLWAERGYATHVTLKGRYATVLVCLPRAKPDARAMIAEATALSDGPLIVDGQKSDGVDSIFKDMRRRSNVLPPLSKAHGKLFVCPEPDAHAYEDWRAGPALAAAGFWTAPGVFSADGIDPASALLVAELPRDLGATVADLGAGWGFLSAHVLTRPGVETVHLVEADHMALECARRNVTDPRTEFHWADALSWQAPRRPDSVVMNPPFHLSRAAEPSIGQAFVKAAASILAPHGQLWIVANRHLPYEQTLQETFTNVFELGGDAQFKLFRATRPKRVRAR